MIKVIPAHLENGHVVPDVPLPEHSGIRSVSIMIDMLESVPRVPKESALPRLFGILRGHDVSEQDYRDYLEQKYQ